MKDLVKRAIENLQNQKNVEIEGKAAELVNSIISKKKTIQRTENEIKELKKELTELKTEKVEI